MIHTLNKQYINALKLLSKSNETESRGLKFKELILYIFKINTFDNLITIPGFETNIKYAEEELKWYYAATNKIDFSPVIKKTWQKFSDDNMTVNSAYGIRIFGKHKIININQWDWCIEKLKNDIGSRQAIINLNSYFDKLTLTKDFVCTIYFQIFIRNNKLIWITNMRSQDIYYGTRNDIYCFTKMQQRMAKELNIECGEYIHICNSLHIYEQQYYKLKEVM